MNSESGPYSLVWIARNRCLIMDLALFYYTLRYFEILLLYFENRFNEYF